MTRIIERHLISGQSSIQLEYMQEALATTKTIVLRKYGHLDPNDFTVEFDAGRIYVKYTRAQTPKEKHEAIEREKIKLEMLKHKYTKRLVDIDLAELQEFIDLKKKYDEPEWVTRC